MLKSIDTLLSAFAGQFPSGGIEEQSLRIAHRSVVRGDLITAQQILKYVNVPDQLKTQILNIYDQTTPTTDSSLQTVSTGPSSTGKSLDTTVTNPDEVQMMVTLKSDQTTLNHSEMNTPTTTLTEETTDQTTSFGNTPETIPITKEALVDKPPMVPGALEPIDQNIQQNQTETITGSTTTIQQNALVEPTTTESTPEPIFKPNIDTTTVIPTQQSNQTKLQSGTSTPSQTSSDGKFELPQPTPLTDFTTNIKPEKNWNTGDRKPIPPTTPLITPVSVNTEQSTQTLLSELSKSKNSNPSHGDTLQELWKTFTKDNPTHAEALQTSSETAPHAVHPKERKAAFESLITTVQTKDATAPSGIIAPEAHIPVIKTYAPPPESPEHKQLTKTAADRAQKSFEMLEAFLNKAISSGNTDLLTAALRQYTTLKIRHPEYLEYYPDHTQTLEELVRQANTTSHTTQAPAGANLKKSSISIGNTNIHVGMTITGKNHKYTITNIEPDIDTGSTIIVFQSGINTFRVPERRLATALADETIQPDKFFADFA